MPHIVHRIGIKAALADVRKAVSTVDGVARWWSRDTTGSGEKLEVVFRKKDGAVIGDAGFDVTAVEHDQVRWRFVSGPPEWIGTDVTFQLAEADGMTIVRFGHRDWREEVEFMGHCSLKWATFLLSLKALLETGEGLPAPDDLKIDNWN